MESHDNYSSEEESEDGSRLGDDPQFRGSIQDRSRHQSLLVPTPRMDTLEDWSFRRGALLRSPIKFFFRGAPRLNDQSDRVSILGVRISNQLQTVFFPIFHFSPLPLTIEMRECLKH
jgi:hypothetical protein